jgi:hypothetical protein
MGELMNRVFPLKIRYPYNVALDYNPEPGEFRFGRGARSSSRSRHNIRYHKLQ